MTFSPGSDPSGPLGVSPIGVGVGVDVAALQRRITELMPGIRAELEALVAIPSVSAGAFDQQHVEHSAEQVAELLRAAAMPEVSILRTGGRPAVVARRPAPAGAPTVLLYAHHDVQPPGPPTQWQSPPFQPTERDGRLFGRGAADDKAGVMVHVASLRAMGDDLGVGVTVFVEGEEEIGSPTFAAFLAEHRDLLAADVIIVADSSNWRVGEPALTTSLRGLVDGVIEVRTLDHGLHSGMFGGAVPDAMTALITLLARLWDADGSLVVPGLVSGEADDLPYPPQALRQDAGVLDGVQLIGAGRLTSRLWNRPALTVIGIDAPSVAEASNTLQPVVRAKFSLRVAPGQDPAQAFEALTAHLHATAPWGAVIDVQPGELAAPWSGELDGEVYATARWALEQAWGVPPVNMGVGGSIPFIPQLQQVYPHAVVLVTGVEDPDTRAHGANESLHLADFERACLAQTLLLAGLAAPAG